MGGLSAKVLVSKTKTDVEEFGEPSLLGGRPEISACRCQKAKEGRIQSGIKEAKSLVGGDRKEPTLG